MKSKYMKITQKMIEDNFRIDYELNNSENFKRIFVEYKGKKFMCTKIGKEEWTTEKIDDWPYYKLPADFYKLK